MPHDIEVQRAVIGVANLYRGSGPPTDEAVAEAKAELAATKIAAYIKRTVDAAPPLSDEQRDRLAALLRGAEQ